MFPRHATYGATARKPPGFGITRGRGPARRRSFFFATKGGRPVGLSAVGMRVARPAKTVGVRLTTHDLGRGFISYYAARVPAAVPKELARHSDLNVTAAYCANMSAAAAVAAVRARPGTARANMAGSGPSRNTRPDGQGDAGRIETRGTTP
jgi:hypothetical protein